jgi:hypothetical protein
MPALAIRSGRFTSPPVICCAGAEQSEFHHWAVTDELFFGRITMVLLAAPRR